MNNEGKGQINMKPIKTEFSMTIIIVHFQYYLVYFQVFE